MPYGVASEQFFWYDNGPRLSTTPRSARCHGLIAD
jgi:hypothetical protein